MKRLIAVLAANLLLACGGNTLDIAGSEGLGDSSAELTSEETGRYIVKFRDASAGRRVLAEAGGRVEKELGPQNAVAARLPKRAVAALRNARPFQYIEEDVIRVPLSQTTPYGIPMVQADQLFATADGTARKVCIIDSGFYVGHEDLQTGNITGYPSGWNNDTCGHGTHVAGTVAALNNNTGVVGVMPNGVNLHIIKVFDGTDCGWSYSSDLIDALNRCVAAGSNIVSMSLGGSFASRTEDAAFADAYNQGVLNIAAAGNDGSTRKSYPASYASVISVAAIDSTKTVASFSQKNDAVELAAPGVAVLSTLPFNDTNTIEVSGVTYVGGRIDGAARTTGVSAASVDGGLCDSVGSWSGKVVLCERGSISFADKVNNVTSGGGVAAVIYNNVSGGFLGTLGDGVTSTTPAISLSQEDGQYLVANTLGLTSTVVSLYESPGNGYEAWDGTSMATPHVSGVAASVWSHNTSWTNAQIRDALAKTAEDLGSAGRDTSYGYGLTRAKAALDYLGGSGGGGTTNAAPTASFTSSCTELSCTFTNTSTDSDGTITASSWDFGDGNGSTATSPSHTYAAAGTYTVTLTVTDDGSATSTTTATVTVSTTTTTGISLTATGYKVKGSQNVDLGWSGATSTSIDVIRNGSKITTTANDGFHTDSINKKGGGTYTYKVCEAGTSTCSAEQVVNF